MRKEEKIKPHRIIDGKIMIAVKNAEKQLQKNLSIPGHTTADLGEIAILQMACRLYIGALKFVSYEQVHKASSEFCEQLMSTIERFNPVVKLEINPNKEGQNS